MEELLNNSKIIKGCKIRVFPTKEQEELLWKHYYACKFIWNYMLAYQNANQINNGSYISGFQMINMLTDLKKQNEYDWLNEVSRQSLARTCQELDNAYQRFFNNKNVGHPKFKTKRSNVISFPIRNDKVDFHGDYVTIEKFKKLKIKNKKNMIGKTYNPRISFINKKWILSFSIECENQASIPKTTSCIGIDLGIKNLATVSYDNKMIIFHNINKSKRVYTLEKKLKHIQRAISRKRRTNNIDKSKSVLKYEAIANEIHYKLKNIRENYIHQITHELVNLYPSSIVMEDLDVLNLLKNKQISNFVHRQCFHKFIRQMKYKCEWNGIQFIQADKYFPSSKTCSCCGNIKKDLKLSDRTYNCSKCGLKIDRDYNAAINLMKYVGHNERLTA